MEESNISERDVAEWIAAEIKSRKELYHDDAVTEIRQKFGERFLRASPDGGVEISPEVMEEVEKLSGSPLSWSIERKCWCGQK
jgi:hypothetical protein